MSRRFERRDFLKAALSCVALLPPVASIGCSDGSSTTPTPQATTSRARRMTDGFFDETKLEAAALIGQRYLALVAPNATDADVDALVAPTVQLLEADDDDDTVLETVRTHVLADFGEASTTVVDGWTFATTELHLCVLARSLVV